MLDVNTFDTLLQKGQCSTSLIPGRLKYENTAWYLLHGDSAHALVYSPEFPFQRFYVRSTITHILGNLKRMRTITHAIDTRPYFNEAWNRG